MFENHCRQPLRLFRPDVNFDHHAAFEQLAKHLTGVLHPAPFFSFCQENKSLTSPNQILICSTTMSIITTPETTRNRTSWGRASEVSTFTLFGTLTILMGAPLLVLYFYLAAFYYHCSLLAPLIALWKGELSITLPTLTREGSLLVLIWLALQLGLSLSRCPSHKILPAIEAERPKER